MTMSGDTGEAAGHRGAWWTALGLAALVYAALLAWHCGAVAGGADSSGYLNHARLLSEGRLRTPVRAVVGAPALGLSAFAYMPLGFTPADPGDATNMVPTYPPGLPLLIAGAAPAVGWERAPAAMMVGHAVAGLALLYAFARRLGVSQWGAAAGGLLLATSPLYPFATVQVLSDVPALVWVLAAVLAAMRSADRIGWAAVAGVAFGFAVFVRPTNVLALAPIACALGTSPRRWVAFVTAGLPLAAAWFGYNAYLYGHPLRTGYGWTGGQFGGAWVGITLRHYAIWLPVLLTPGVVLALGLPWLREVRWREQAMLASWVAAFGGFYLFYVCTHETWWYLRFLLPAFPAIVVAGLLVGEALLRRVRVSWRRGLAAVSIVAALAWSIAWAFPLRSWRLGQDERAYVEACTWARANVPPHAVVLATQVSGAARYYTDFTLVNWAQLTPADVAQIRRAAAVNGQPLFAVLFPAEETGCLRAVPGDWERVATLRKINVWRMRAATAP